MQEGLADIWKENILEDLETEKVKYKSAGEFLTEIKKEFRGGDKESLKVVELKRIEQEDRTREKFMQDFKRVTRGSGYERCLLIEEFKWGINGAIRRKLMEAENQPGLIKQWFKKAIALKREPKRRREVEREEREQWGTSSKVKQLEGTKANVTMAPSLAKEVGDRRCLNSRFP